ncbi:MAG: redoxin family protein [Planctomycetaceae bacterium]|nr:redoxin family protein [Planctomycetaceae bacterium]
MADLVRIAIAVLLLVGGRADAQSVSLDVGDRAPVFDALEGVDGEFYGTRELEQTPILVVCFTSNTCPYSVDYEDRLIALQKKYGEAGRQVRVVAINSNATDGDSLKKMIDRAEDKAFNFLYLRDDDQLVAKAFGAIYTPEFFVLNRDRRVVYKGALDDSSKAENVTRSWVELAIAAIQSGKTPEVTKTGARGCAIRFPRRRRRKPDDKL